MVHQSTSSWSNSTTIIFNLNTIITSSIIVIIFTSPQTHDITVTIIDLIVTIITLITIIIITSINHRLHCQHHIINITIFIIIFTINITIFINIIT